MSDDTTISDFVNLGGDIVKTGISGQTLEDPLDAFMKLVGESIQEAVEITPTSVDDRLIRLADMFGLDDAFMAFIKTSLPESAREEIVTIASRLATYEGVPESERSAILTLVSQMVHVLLQIAEQAARHTSTSIDDRFIQAAQLFNVTGIVTDLLSERFIPGP